MTLAQAQEYQRDSLVLGRRNSPRYRNENHDGLIPPMIVDIECRLQKLDCRDFVPSAKEKHLSSIHDCSNNASSPRAESPNSKVTGVEPHEISKKNFENLLVRKKSINSLYKEVSLKHGIPDSALDKPVFKTQDSLIMSKKRTPKRAHGNSDALSVAEN